MLTDPEPDFINNYDEEDDYNKIKPNTKMYWVVDPHITLAGDWKFDYVPTKWEEHVVHVWLDSEDNKRGVRLIPKNTFTDNKYTIKQLINNTFTDLKTVYRVASQPTTWKCYAFNTETPLLKQLNQQ